MSWKASEPKEKVPYPNINAMELNELPVFLSEDITKSVD